MSGKSVCSAHKIYYQLTGAKHPFLSIITSSENGKAAFMGGKLLLVLEAFTQIRPHLGLSSNLAAFQALELVNVLNGDKSVDEWEQDVVEYGQEFALRSKAVGHFGMTGKWPEGYVPPLPAEPVPEGI
jgi:hypothetical protein